MEILQRAEDNGYVHQITNIDGEEKIFAICNCAIGVCNGLRTSQLFNTPNMSRSAYRASVTKEDCVACGRCVEYCPTGAAKLVQRTGKSNIPGRSFPMKQSGAGINGAWTIGTGTRSIAMIPVPLPAKRPVRPIFRYRAISKWPHRANTWMR